MTKQKVNPSQRLRTHATVCAIEDCDQPVHARGWCDKHYWRWLHYGDPLHLDGRSRPSAAAIAASVQARQARAREKGEVLAEEIEWFLAAGESPHKIMGVLGYAKPDSLARRMHRQGRKDLAALYWQVTRRERVVA